MSANANPSMPQDNPVLKLYTDWSERTPYVTRGSMIVLVVAYILSFFFSADLALGNIPYFTIFYFEIYRPVLSPLVGNSILTLILICFFYPSMGKRIEDSIGSSGFLFLLGTLSLLVNGIFLAICMVLYTLGQGDALFYSCSGFWTVIFALLTMECMLSPDAPKRMLLIPVDIPSKYFPLVLYGFFCLFSGLQLSFAISIGVGYAYHKGYLDKLRVSSYYLESLETNGGVLHGISRSRGWILSGAALGHDAWVALNSVRTYICSNQ
jgi:membrane associated rhomboid family serine protease